MSLKEEEEEGRENAGVVADFARGQHTRRLNETLMSAAGDLGHHSSGE